METNRTCPTPARPAAPSRRSVPSTSTRRVLVGLEAQWTTEPTPSNAASTPSPVARSPGTVPGRPLLLITRTRPPAPRSRSTTRLPKAPVPPVTRNSRASPTPKESAIPAPGSPGPPATAVASRSPGIPHAFEGRYLDAVSGRDRRQDLEIGRRRVGGRRILSTGPPAYLLEEALVKSPGGVRG